jgi:hypothetical protein
LQVLRLVEFDVDADGLWQPASKELGLLEQCEVASMCEPRLERLQVRLDGGCERQPRQVRQVIGTNWRTKPLLAEELECLPVQLTDVPLQDDVSVLHHPLQVVGGEPNAISVRGELGSEELLIFVEPSERIHRAVERGEGELVEARDSVARGCSGAKCMVGNGRADVCGT